MTEKLAVVVGRPMGESHGVLSNREIEAMKLIASRGNLVNIAKALRLSTHTVTIYRARIYEKIGFGSNVELTRYEIENWLV